MKQTLQGSNRLCMEEFNCGSTENDKRVEQQVCPHYPAAQTGLLTRGYLPTCAGAAATGKRLRELNHATGAVAAAIAVGILLDDEEVDELMIS